MFPVCNIYDPTILVATRPTDHTVTAALAAPRPANQQPAAANGDRSANKSWPLRGQPNNNPQHSTDVAWPKGQNQSTGAVRPTKLLMAATRPTRQLQQQTPTVEWPQGQHPAKHISATAATRPTRQSQQQPPTVE